MIPMDYCTLQEQQKQFELHELARQIVVRIEKFGTVEGFADCDLLEIIKKTKEILTPLPALIEVVSPIVVFGDIHGQLGDLMQFIRVVGRPPIRQLLFLGDYVDRGCNSLETFCELPLCASVNRKILCMHGGISPKIESWVSLSEMSKPRVHAECESGQSVDILWSDPNKKFGDFQVNASRGISCQFGKSSVDRICKNLDIDLIIRAHQLKMKGHEFEFEHRLLTISRRQTIRDRMAISHRYYFWTSGSL
uniref:SER_THR_PHOSPHATASE domain-containing protein n=1 Tax=Caenorhabditis japonica TaxID=281687 RepID=A0A8R1E307_CAEJA